MTTMDATAAAKLRAPFKDDEIGKLPRIWCGNCRQSPSKNCNTHQKTRCNACNNNISTAHQHLDYVGHAEVTDRLLQVDTQWTWEPLAFDTNGLPQLDQTGGMWIRLTVAGVTRIGYGDPAGKKGSDAVKETIGDALRNAAMRFGVALDLWGAKFEAAAQVDESPADIRTATVMAERMVTVEQHRAMHAIWADLGYAGDANREKRLHITARILSLPDLETSAELTEAEAGYVLEALRTKLREQRSQPAGAAA